MFEGTASAADRGDASTEMTIEARLADLQSKVNFLNDERERLLVIVDRATKKPDVSMVDSKAIGRPDVFRNTEETWPDFYFKFTNWLVALNPNTEIAIDYVEEQTDEINSYSTVEAKGFDNAKSVSIKIVRVMHNL